MAATASLSVAADFSGQKRFSAAFGGEYQFISQEYYLQDYEATLDTTNIDQIEIWKLDKDEINDFIFRTNLGYNFRAPSKRVNLLADIEFSGDRLIGRSEGSFRLGDYDNNLRLFGKFESKSPTGDNDTRIEEYTYYQTGLSGRRRLTDRVSLEFRAGFENVSFAGENDDSVLVDDSLINKFSNFDYSIFSAAIGGEFTISEFVSALTWRGGWKYRAVPDSTRAEYDQYRFDLGYTYFSLKTIISLDGEVEFRDYAQPNDTNDFSAITIKGRFSHNISDRFQAGMLLATDIYSYKKTDIINRDYTRYIAEAKGIYSLNGFGLGPLLRLESRSEAAVKDDIIDDFSETYSQWEAGIQAEFLDTRALFLDSELTYGRRNYREGEGFLSSYNLWSVSFLASYSIFKNLSVDGMFDGTFESHSDRNDDSNLYLLSIGVTARF